MPRSRLLVGIAALLVVASLTFSGSAFAHNISLVSARSKVRRYAQKIVDAPSSRYTQAITTCNKAFNGHNHYVRCMVQYKDQETEGKGRVYACTEHIEVFFVSHNLLRGENDTYYMRHVSRECGDRRLVN